jgi:hypothetical protein
LDLAPARLKKRANVPRSSRLTYQAEQGRIGKRGDLVRGWLKSHATVTDAPTSAELARWVFGEDFEPVADALYVRRGLSDLQSAGVAEHGPMRRCRVSGRTCVTWRLRHR